MGTMKRSLLWAGVIGLMCAATTAGVPGRASAQALIGSDIPAAIVTFPVVRVNEGVDTYIQLANTDQVDVHAMQCFYINGLGTCSSSGVPCLVRFDCPGAAGGEQCNPDWVEQNFFIDFTAQQPLGWQASTGLDFLPCDPSQVGNGSQPTCGDLAQSNGAGGVPDVVAPFVGFLTCVGIQDINDTAPSGANVFIGTATVIQDVPAVANLDTYTYNGIGIQAEENVGADHHLCLGGAPDTTCPDAEYASCPQTLLMNNLLDRSNPTDEEFITTRLVLIPCTQLESPRPDHVPGPDVVPTTAQFLVFNEFEQRTSTSTRASCYTDLLLSDIDTRPSFPGDDSNSIFNVAVQGTIGAQTRIRGVATNEPDVGHGLLGVAIQTISSPDGVTSAAVNLNFQGVRTQPDVICTTPGACEPNEP
jgi:hypothetical protein